MRLLDFAIGREFFCGERRWRCTDVGSRVVVAICLDEPTTKTLMDHRGIRTVPVSDDERPSWHRGPPYAVKELVFDETDLPGCTLTLEEQETR